MSSAIVPTEPANLAGLPEPYSQIILRDDFSATAHFDEEKVKERLRTIDRT